MSDNNGYTLLEVMVVLTITSIIIIGMSFGYQSFYQKGLINQYLTGLGSDFQQLQTIAVNDNEEGSIKLRDDGYDVYTGRSIVKEVNFNQRLDVSSNFSGDKIKVNEFGNISRAGTVTINNNNHNGKIIFPIGRGRYRIE